MPVETQRFVVKGQVLFADGTPASRIRVEAVDIDWRNEELLFETYTDEQGNYEGTYTAEQFKRAERRSADVTVRAYQGRNLLGKSEIRFNTRETETIHVDVSLQEQLSLPEFERLRDLLAPVWGDQPPTGLEEGEVAFLKYEFSDEPLIDERRLKLFVQSNQLAQGTALPTEFFYGVSRVRGEITLPLRLEAFLILSRMNIRQAITLAVNQSIIPPLSVEDLLDQFDQLRFKHSFLVAGILRGEIVSEGTGQPLAGYKVLAVALDAEEAPKELGFDITDRRGRFEIQFTSPRRDVGEEQDSPSDQPIQKRFRLQIHHPDGREILETEIVVALDQPEIFTIPVTVPQIPGAADVSLTDLAQQLEFEIPNELRSYLAEKNIRTLADIQREGGISRFEDLPIDPDHELVRALNAHANLSVLSEDAGTRHKLYRLGFDKLSTIARTPRARFIEALNGDLGDLKAAELHVKARAQADVLNNILTSLRVESTGYQTKSLLIPAQDSVAEESGFQKFPGLENKVFGRKCACENCEAVVSPLAYLADLLDYTMTHLVNNGSPVTLKWLTKTFHQPFGDLPVSCEEMNRKVRQVRICIEVLRSYLSSLSPPLSQAKQDALANAENHYLMQVYITLLTRIGTSYDAIRLIRHADSKRRQFLADRLGIDLEPNGVDPFEQLFFQSADLTEQSLEHLFGFIDTKRDPLSEGAKLDDDDDQITRWNLNGIQWGRNTDAGGRVYVTVRKDGSNFWVELHRDHERTQLVASGKRASPKGSVDLKEKNDSKLSGTFQIDYSADDTIIQISAIPDFLSWRLKYLRNQWSEQDWPSDSYTENAAIQVPIIDPDVIGPDDFRNPDPGNDAFALWLSRRGLIDVELVVLANARNAASDLDSFIENELATPIADLENWRNDLIRDAELKKVEEIQQKVNDMGLPVSAFLRLMEIREKQNAAQDPEAEQVTTEEWRELDSILLQRRKEALYESWRIQEQQSGLQLGPKEFWISLREPVKRDWPPVPIDDYPRIDPEKVKLEDLPEPTAGKDALQLWKVRRAKLDGIYADLKEQHETNGFDAMLIMAIGDGNSLPHNLDDLKTDLENSDPVIVDAAKQKITNDLFMSVDSLIRLTEIKSKTEQSFPANQPGDEELAEAYAILTSAQKRKREYPGPNGWIAEEQLQGMDIAYWKAIKARIPLWRASMEARNAWQQALRTRSRAPHIDPDLIGPDYFQNPSEGPAYALWKTRRDDWIKIQMDALQTTPQDLSGFDFIVHDSIGVSPDELSLLADQEQNGESIMGRLEQLSLPRNALARLIQIHRLLSENAPILDKEWEDVYSILLQVKKCREFADWREEERAQNLMLGPDEFRFPEPAELQFPPVEPAPPPNWRGTLRQHRDLEDQLQSRMDQHDAAIQALRQAVESTEEETLSLMRNALILALDNEAGNTLESKSGWVTNNLLIDAKTDTCMITTRIAQAIETLQGLLWSERTGQLEDTYPELDLEAENFDGEWKWIGSYSTWRSAVFVWAYPENILIPSLLRRHTPAFGRLIDEVRKNRRLTPEDACEAARSYSEYFEDVCTLKIEVTCQAKTRLYQGDACKRIKAGHANLLYMFGQGAKSKAIYWSTYDSDKASHQQTFWDAVPGLQNVIQIAGSVPYDLGDGRRYIFLFALTHEKGQQKLKFTRYDLESGSWDVEPGELELPSESGTCKVVAQQEASDTKPPVLAIHYGTRFNLYFRPMNLEASDWETSTEDDEWDAFRYVILGQPKEIHAVQLISFSSGGFARILYYTWTDDGLKANVYANVSDTEVQNTFSLYGNRPAGSLLSPVNPGGYLISEGGGWITSMLIHVLGLGSAASDTTGKVIGYMNRLSPSFGPPSKEGRRIVYSRFGEGRGNTQALVSQDGTGLEATKSSRISPLCNGPFEIISAACGVNLQARRKKIKQQFKKNEDGPESNRTYLREAYYFIPMFLALQLQKRGEFIPALDFYRTVYDWSAPPQNRKIYYGLEEETSYSSNYERESDWLLDPLDPHRIAATRANTNTRFTELSLIRCFLEYADAEFTRDTAESLPRARTLYLTALELLETPELSQPNGCSDLIIELGEKLAGEPGMNILINSALKVQTEMSSDQFKDLIGNLTEAMSGEGSWETRFREARNLMKQRTQEVQPQRKMSDLLEEKAALTDQSYTALLTGPEISMALTTVGDVAGLDFQLGMSQYKQMKAESQEEAFVLSSEATAELAKPWQMHPTPISPPSFEFCIPPNPIIESLRLHAELNLYKLRTCRNIAGMERELDPYAAPTDIATGLPMIGVGGQLVLPGLAQLSPTQYRFAVLIERAKQQAQLAAQIEAQMLSSLEKRDAEYYSLMKARQDVQVTRQGIRLHSLRLKEAIDNVELALLQRDRAQLQVDTYQGWLDEGRTMWEEYALQLLILSAAFHVASAAAEMAKPMGAGVAAGLGALGSAATVGSTAASLYASYERREQEWEFQKALAEYDVRIGDQQIKLAEDRERIVGQELRIAEIQADHAQDTVEFLANKFTNVELYDWMSDVLEGVYSILLQDGAATAKLAESQLGFLRQETPPAFIQADYWEAPAGMEVGGDPHSAAPDRRGLTGSARLLADIQQLDQYAFDTDQRKLQLTKTISLSQLSPAEFQRFRETGVMNFATPMKLFDRDFPGHYLRLIRQVRTSVIALIPPTVGIHATLSTSGLSRVTISGGTGFFQTVPVKIPPQTVSLTSPMNATGLFELTTQSQEMLFPFEGTGVDALWELRVPKASNLIDFNAIADVLISIDYTALDSYDYRQKVIRELDTRFSADRAFSFRHQFADQWYDLHNPDQTSEPMVVRFEITREDFPPNLDALKIQHVVLYFARENGAAFEVSVEHLLLTEKSAAIAVGGSATSIDGIISTRKGNAGSWSLMIGQSPAGSWKLAFPNNQQMKNLFKQEKISDILLVITFTGHTPEWPA